MDRINTLNKALNLFGIGKHGWKNRNIGLGVEPTEFSAEWCNGLQEELLSLIEAAGIAPDPAVRNQVLSALRSPGVFQTPGRFNDSSRPATTQFLASNGFAYRKGQGVGFSGNYNVSFEEAGAWFQVDGANEVVTLPLMSQVQLGTTYTFRINATGVIIRGQGTDVIWSVKGDGVINLATLPGEVITLVCNGNGWYVTSAGFGAESYAGGAAANDYQRSPSGFIFQWGIATFPNTGTTVSATAVTYPIAFPSVNFFAFCTPRLSANSTAGGITPVSTTGSSTTGAVFTADTLNFTTFNRSITGFYFAGGR